MTGNVLMRHPSRMAGTYQIAYAATTPSGKTGVVLFVYEYDKRDIMDERVYTSPEIEDEMREFLGDESPVCFSAFAFPGEGGENQNGSAVTDALHQATVLVYGWEG